MCSFFAIYRKKYARNSGAKVDDPLKGVWYLRKVTSSCEQLRPVFTCLCLKYIKFCFRNLGNGREDENRRKRTTFVFDNKKMFSIDFAKIELFSIYWTKVVYLLPFLSSFSFIKFWNQISMYFGHKHVET